MKPSTLNWSAFFVGMVVVWFASHNWVAMLGAFIASLHISVRIVPKP